MTGFELRADGLTFLNLSSLEHLSVHHHGDGVENSVVNQSPTSDDCGAPRTLACNYSSQYSLITTNTPESSEHGTVVVVVEHLPASDGSSLDTPNTTLAVGSLALGKLFLVILGAAPTFSTLEMVDIA